MNKQILSLLTLAFGILAIAPAQSMNVERKIQQAEKAELSPAAIADIKKRALAEFSKFLDNLTPNRQQTVPSKALDFMRLLNAYQDAPYGLSVDKEGLLSHFIDVIEHDRAQDICEASHWEVRTFAYRKALVFIYPAGHEAFKKAEPTASNIIEKMARQSLTKSEIMIVREPREVYITIPDIMDQIESILKKGDKSEKNPRRSFYQNILAVLRNFLPNNLSSMWSMAKDYHLAYQADKGDAEKMKADWHRTAQPLMDLYCEIYRVYNTYYSKGGELPATQFDPEILKKQIGWLGK